MNSLKILFKLFLINELSDASDERNKIEVSAQDDRQVLDLSESKLEIKHEDKGSGDFLDKSLLTAPDDIDDGVHTATDGRIHTGE